MLSWEGEDVWVSVCKCVCMVECTWGWWQCCLGRGRMYGCMSVCKCVDVWLSVPGGGGDVVLGRGRCLAAEQRTSFVTSTDCDERG